MTPALEIFRIETEPILSGSPTIAIDSTPNIDNPNDVLAPGLELPGLELPGLNLPGMNLPGMNLPQ